MLQLDIFDGRRCREFPRDTPCGQLKWKMSQKVSIVHFEILLFSLNWNLKKTIVVEEKTKSAHAELFELFTSSSTIHGTFFWGYSHGIVKIFWLLVKAGYPEQIPVQRYTIGLYRLWWVAWVEPFSSLTTASKLGIKILLLQPWRKFRLNKSHFHRSPSVSFLGFFPRLSCNSTINGDTWQGIRAGRINNCSILRVKSVISFNVNLLILLLGFIYLRYPFL